MVVSCFGHSFLDLLHTGKIFEEDVQSEGAPPEGMPSENAPPEGTLPGDTPPDDLPCTDTWQSDNGSTIMIRHPEAESRGEHVESVSERLDRDSPPPPAAPPLQKPKRIKCFLGRPFRDKARR